MITDSQATELFRTAPDRFVDTGDGGAVAVRTVGSGPDLLLVHGWPVSGATWRRVLTQLSQHYTCHVIDLVGAGDSRFTRETPISVRGHVDAIRAVIEALGLESYRALGHDSGGMFTRHAVAGDPRLKALGLVNTEQPSGLNWRFKAFLVPGKLPGFAKVLGWASMKPRLRANKFLLGDAFADRSLLGGEFEEFFLAPLANDADRQWAAGTLVRTWDNKMVSELREVHSRITCPVTMVWGVDDPFFRIGDARDMVGTFPDARLIEVEDAKLFVHEEKPAEVAQALIESIGTD